MIIKNEEQYLPYCLGCIYDKLDELIILDTGSTDKTLEIVEGFCEHIPTSVILHMDWKYDFALARNISQGGAKSTHILWLDGDEVFDDVGVLKIKNELIYDDSADFWLMPRINFWKDLRHMWEYPDSQYKLYRNIGLKWEHKIHERIYQDSFHSRLRSINTHIFHYAYVKDPMIVAEKMANYIKIENPEMDMMEIRKISTQHSYFNNDFPPGVQRYHQGVYPEIFKRLEITKKHIRVGGKNVVTFKGRTFYNNFICSLNDVYKDVFVSIVVVTFNKLDYVKECLQSIYLTTHIGFEVILVDNGSTEDVRGWAEGLNENTFHNFHYYRLEENTGFSHGYNYGIQKASGEFIMVLNNDTVMTDNFIVKLLDVYYSRKPLGDAGLIGCLSNKNPSENGTLEEFKDKDIEGCVKIIDDRIKSGEWSEYIESSWMTGICYLFHRELLDELGKIERPRTQGIMFEERLPVYHNDTELNWRIQHRLGKKCWIANTAFLWHYGKITVSTLTSEEYNTMKAESENVLKELWPEIAGEIF